MLLKQLFMTVTAFISIVCFNFNKVIDSILYCISKCIYDDLVLTVGPYGNSKPIEIKNVLIDGIIFKNKFDLMLNWKWDFEFSGISKLDIVNIKPDAENVIIEYCQKYNDNSFKIIKVDMNKNYLVKNNKRNNLLFNEIRFYN